MVLVALDIIDKAGEGRRATALGFHQSQDLGGIGGFHFGQN